jgi:hypothetical protein
MSTSTTTTAPSALAVALAAIGRGWRVFPLLPGGKVPAIPSAHPKADPARGRCRGECGRLGHGLWDATNDAEVARRWWARRPAPNVGIATGLSGLLVIDLDTPKPDTPPPPEHLRQPGIGWGADVLAVLCERYAEPFPAGTFTVATGRGGWHLYFRQPPGTPLGNTTGGRPAALGWLIDTRGHGGYVVAPGSVVDGRSYSVLDRSEPALLPAWLARLLTRPDPAAVPRTAAAAVPEHTRGYVAAALHGEVRNVLASLPGSRNTVLFEAALALGRFVAAGELPRHVVEQALQNAAEHIGPDPAKIAGTISRGINAAATRARTA